MWVEEKHEDFLIQRYRIEEILYSKQSKFQHVQVVQTKGFGRMLLNDGIVMVTERDEFIYHEMIAHVPLFIHPNPQHVLVIGGGDGGTVREVLRHPTVKSCTLVEIDECVVEACKKFLAQTACQLDDHRVDLRIEDGVKYMKETTQVYDVIIVDSSDPLGPAVPLFNAEFYHNVYLRLAPDGIVVLQCESPFYETTLQKTMLQILKAQFPIVSIYNYSNLTYPGGLWSFGYGSKKYHPTKDYKAEKIEGWDFLYYNAGIHVASFQLPNFMQHNLK